MNRHNGPGAVSVVIITRDRKDELLHTLDRLHALPEAPPVVVVDNGSTDGTSGAVTEEFPDVRLLSLAENHGAVGRNLGVFLADSPYVAFCDDDTWWEPGSLAAAAEVLDRHPRIAVVTARIVVEPSGVEDPICEDMRYSPLETTPGLPGHPLLSFLAGASVVRRQAFQEIGGFEPRFFFDGEEELLAADLVNAGWALVFVPELLVHHQPSCARDAHDRRRRGIRNTLWFAWLRRPVRSALRRSVALVRRLPPDRVSAAGLLDAVRGARWVLRHRRVVSPEVEAGLRRLDHSQLTSRARRYVS